MIKKHVDRNGRNAEMKDWSIPEILLLGPKIRVKEAQTLSRILDAWYVTRKELVWTGAEIHVPNDTPMRKVEAVLIRLGGIEADDLKKARRWWKKLHWETIGDWSRLGDLEQEAEKELWRTGVFLEEHDRITLHRILAALRRIKPQNSEMQKLKGWKWAKIPDCVNVWEISRRQIQDLFLVEWLRKKRNQNRRLERNYLDKREWKLLWESKAGHRAKLEIWKTCHEGYFTNHRAAKMGVREDTCAWCNSQPETAVWHERNKHIFEGKRMLTPLRLIMGRALRSLRARQNSGHGGQEREQILQTSIVAIELGMEEGSGTSTRTDDVEFRLEDGDDRRDGRQSDEYLVSSEQPARRRAPARRVGITVDSVTRGRHPGRPPDRY
ncbi:hypothetical protein R1flu_015613 [Riccia fluitans]|uniref:Uncharacterized protein n=1 Tax=Riccia fluitans TaxID=41844 RepID=A0ABD1YMI6_9MARC